MGRAAFVICCVGLVACFHDKPGVSIEVTTTPGVQRIELYLSTQPSCGGNCPAITPPDHHAQPGTGWIIDDVTAYYAATSADTSFLVENTTAADVTVQRALALGLDAAGRPLSVAAFGPFVVTHDSSAVARVTLVPADPIGTTSPLEHVTAWDRPPGLSDKTSCVVVQHAGAAPSTEFFVPKDDLDCDSVQGSECAPLVYQAVNSPPTNIADASCAATSGTFCVLGGRCSEIPGPDVACMPLAAPSPTYCMPDELCDPMAAACGSYSMACMGARIRGHVGLGTATMPKIDCMLYVDTLGAPCGTGTGTFDASAVAMDQGTTKCRSIELGALKTPPTFATSGMVGTTSIALSNFQDTDCLATIAISGTLLAPPGGIQTEIGMTKIVTDSKVTRVVPLVFSWQTADCVNIQIPFACTGNPGLSTSSLYSCH
jgi:hypothetical protein